MISNSNPVAWIKALADEIYAESLPPPTPQLPAVADGLDITGVFNMTSAQIREALAEFKDGIAA